MSAKPRAGRVGDRRLAGRVHDVRIGAAGEQRIDDAAVALECRGRERRDARRARQIRDRRLSQQRARRSPAARSRPRRRARSRRRGCARRSPPPARGRDRPAPCVPTRAARASGMAPNRSRASSDAPAASRRRASGTQPVSAAENSTRLSCAEVVSALSQIEPALELAAGRGRVTGPAPLATPAIRQAASEPTGSRQGHAQVIVGNRGSLSDHGAPM